MYRLRDVKRLIEEDKYEIDMSALQRMYDDFGWDYDDIKPCFKKLTGNHYYKTDPHNSKPEIGMDFYRARKLYKNMDVYTHFHIENDCLYISSLHKYQ